jgi:hypothetical protein
MNSLEKIFFDDNYIFNFKKIFFNTNTKIKNEFIPFLPYPKIWKKTEIYQLKKKLEILNSILKKIFNEFFSSEILRNFYDFPPFLEKLILHKPIIKHGYPVLRLDSIYQSPDNFKICEINADGSSGMNEEHNLNQTLLKTKILNQIPTKKYIETDNLIEDWVNLTLHNYKNIFKKYPENIGIFDWKNVGTIEEFNSFQKEFLKKKLNCFILNETNISIKNDCLFYKNKKIDFVYRRLVTQELLNNETVLENFIKPYLKNNFYCAGSFQSEIIHSKILFAILHSKKFNYLFNKAELEFISDHIPFTCKITEILEFDTILKNKNQFLLKPHNAYGARGIFLGIDHNEIEWQTLIEKFRNNNNYLIQKFYSPAKLKFERETYYYLPAFFVYFDKLKGFYTRISKNKIITTNLGAKVIPNIIVEN